MPSTFLSSISTGKSSVLKGVHRNCTSRTPVLLVRTNNTSISLTKIVGTPHQVVIQPDGSQQLVIPSNMIPQQRLLVQTSTGNIIPQGNKIFIQQAGNINQPIILNQVYFFLEYLSYLFLRVNKS